MRMYRTVALDVYQGELRLHAVMDLFHRGPDTTVDDVARAHSCSPAFLFKLKKRVCDALKPAKPGRKPRASTPPSPAPQCPSPAVVPDAPHDDTALLLTLVEHHVSVRGIRDVLAVLQRPTLTPELITQKIQRAGRAARRLIARASQQVRGSVRCLAGDDIFFHRQDVKVLMEPVSRAVLDVFRWPWREGEDWQLWIAQWPALRLFVSDLGTDLVGGCNLQGTPHQADLFHERQWWNDKLFNPLSRREKSLADEVSKAIKVATRVTGPGRRTGAQTVAQIEAERAEVERQFYVAVAAEEKQLELFEALDPRGALWTEDVIADVLNQVCEALVKLPTAVGHRIWKHVYRNRERWCAHRGLWDTVSIHWRESSTMTREELLAVAVRVVSSERPEVHDGPWKTTGQQRFAAYKLREALRAECDNAETVESSVRSLMLRPRRSSSLVESFNSRLRVLQMVHRNVSDELLAIHALIWNMRPRREGKHRGSSPFSALGIDFAKCARSWQETLIEEMIKG